MWTVALRWRRKQRSYLHYVARCAHTTGLMLKAVPYYPFSKSLPDNDVRVIKINKLPLPHKSHAVEAKPIIQHFPRNRNSSFHTWRCMQAPFHRAWRLPPVSLPLRKAHPEVTEDWPSCNGPDGPGFAQHALFLIWVESTQGFRTGPLGLWVGGSKQCCCSPFSLDVAQADSWPSIPFCSLE